jgi:hypothetical protein
VCCQPTPSPDAPVDVPTPSDYSKLLFGGYFDDDEYIIPPGSTLVGGSESANTNLFSSGTPLNCSTVAGTCTTGNCPAGTSFTPSTPQLGQFEDGDCRQDGKKLKCCGNAQQLWSAPDALVVDVPSVYPSMNPASSDPSSFLSERLASEYARVLASLGGSYAEFFRPFPAPRITKFPTSATRQYRPKRPANYRNGGSSYINLKV